MSIPADLGAKDESIFYRFRAPTAQLPQQEEQIFLQNRIYFASLDSLDDIHEGSVTYKIIRKPVGKDRLTNLVKKFGSHYSREQRRQMRHQMQANLRTPLRRAQTNERQRVILDGRLKNSSVCCFCQDASDPVVWSTYADQNRGYCLVFDMGHAWTMHAIKDEPPIDMVPFPIDYVAGDAWPIVEIGLADEILDGFPYIEKVILTKSDRWQHQKESRIFRVDMPGGLVEFPAASLVGVVLGPRMDKVQEARLREIISHRAAKLPIWRAVPRPGQYSYGFDLL